MKKLLLVLIILGGLIMGNIYAQDEFLDADELLFIAERVVLIGIIEGDEFVGNGSGTIVDPSGVIFTNRHVVEDSDDLAIFMLTDIGELPELAYFARVVEVSEQIDFAIIQVDRDADGNPVDPTTLNLPALPLNVASAAIGEEVRVFGYPGIGDGYMVITSGEIVTIQNGEVNGERVPVWYRTDSEFSGGNSGGLAVNNAGQLVGIPTSVVTEDRTSGKLGGLLPFSTVLALIEGASDLSSGDTIVEAPPSATTDQITFTLTNDSNTAVCYVFISPTTATSWGDDQLGAEEIINTGDSRAWQLPADFYDVLLLDCDQEEISDTRNVDLTSDDSLTYTGDAESEAPPPASGQLSVSCGQSVEFDNGVEVVLANLNPGEVVRVSAIGLDGFDPVLAVFDGANEGRCSDDSADTSGYAFNLPTTGTVAPASLNAQLTIEAVGNEVYSVIVGGFDNQTGEFLIVIEGVSLIADDGLGDRYIVNATSLGPQPTVTAYMISTASDLDPILYLTNGDNVPINDDNGSPIACDDAGSSELCWTGPLGVASSEMTVFGGATLRGGERDAALLLRPEILDTYGGARLRFLASSYQQSSFGDYVMILQLSNG